MKKIAARNDVATAGKTLEPLIDALATAGVLTPVKVKRLKSYAAVRNHALHAEWDQIDIREVGELIRGIRSPLRITYEADIQRCRLSRDGYLCPPRLTWACGRRLTASAALPLSAAA